MGQILLRGVPAVVLALGLIHAAWADDEGATARDAAETDEVDEEGVVYEATVLLFHGPAGDVQALTYTVWLAQSRALCSRQPSNVDPAAWAGWCYATLGWDVRPQREGLGLPNVAPPASSAQSDPGHPLPSSSYFAPRDLGLADEARQRVRHAGPPPATPSATLYDQAATPAPTPMPPRSSDRRSASSRSKKR